MIERVIEFSQKTQRHPSIESNFRQAPIVISGVFQWPVLQLPMQFTAKNWDDMMRMLSAMKDGLITEDSPELSPGSGAS